MVWSREFHQQKYLWWKTDSFAITLHIRIQEKDKVTFTWFSNLTEISSILTALNWSSVNMNVYIHSNMKHLQAMRRDILMSLEESVAGMEILF